MNIVRLEFDPVRGGFAFIFGSLFNRVNLKNERIFNKRFDVYKNEHGKVIAFESFRDRGGDFLAGFRFRVGQDYPPNCHLLLDKNGFNSPLSTLSISQTEETLSFEFGRVKSGCETFTREYENWLFIQMFFQQVLRVRFAKAALAMQGSINAVRLERADFK